MASTRPSLMRLLRIHQSLSLRRYPSLVNLAEMCGTHPRTLKRDLRVLREEFNAPLAYCRPRGGYHYTRPFSLAPPPFDERELLALSVAVEVAGAFRNTPFAEAVREALEKLRMMMPGAEQFAFDDAGGAITYVADPAPPERVETVLHFSDLWRAVHEHRQVRLTYRAMSSGREAVRVVDPYQIYLYGGMWYVHGFCHLRREGRDFAINRVQEVKVLETGFAPPDPEALRKRLSQRFTIVEGPDAEIGVWFDGEVAPRIRERIWHSSQRLTDHEDGSCTLTMRVKGLVSVKRWVLSYGRHAEVLEPPELAEEIRREAEMMVRRVREPGSRGVEAVRS